MEDGQTIVATARGVFTSAGGVLESKETGEKEIRCHSMLIAQMPEEKNETRSDRSEAASGIQIFFLINIKKCTANSGRSFFRFF